MTTAQQQPISGSTSVERLQQRCAGPGSTPPTVDRGSMTVYAAVLAPALLLCSALFVNAATRWNAWRDVNAAAQAAARAGAEVSASEFDPQNRRLVVTPARARTRAASILSAHGYSGSVAVNADTVEVTATATVRYPLPLAPFGSNVTGRGVADLETGIRQGQS